MALTLADVPEHCIVGSLFFGLFHFAYSVSNVNATYSMKYCSNSTDCGGKCRPVFNNLPVGVCRATQLGSVGGHVELRNTQDLVVCQEKPQWPLSWILGAAGGALALSLGTFIGAYHFFKNRRHSRRAGYETIN